MKVKAFFLISAFVLSGFVSGFAQESAEPIPVENDSLTVAETPAPATDVVAKDTPNDAGGSITVTWDLSPDDTTKKIVTKYVVMRAEEGSDDFKEIGSQVAGKRSVTDNEVVDGVAYIYKVLATREILQDDAIIEVLSSPSEPVGPAKSTAQWFNMSRLNIFIGIIILCGAIIYYITAARGGKSFYIRKIAGIVEVENAVGRATEMGKAIYYVPGINDMDDVQTLASLTILGKVAEIAAQNDTRIDVPVSRSMVMVTAKEIVKESYSRAGRPEAHQDDQVRYLTDDQFGYAAAIDGLFVREKPATVFLIGAFFAESLIMAETGNSIGAIQIAGTAQPSQLPFFVAACDYTLIGEEMFAASAYLSREPKLLGSLKGQDLGKAVFLFAIVIGIILESFGIPVSNLFKVQ